MSVRFVINLLVGLAAGVGLSACIFNPAASEPAVEMFPEALGICRMQQPGRVNRRVHLPSTHPGVARCLRRRGWNSDGSRIQEAPAGEHVSEHQVKVGVPTVKSLRASDFHALEASLARP